MSSDKIKAWRELPEIDRRCVASALLTCGGIAVCPKAFALAADILAELAHGPSVPMAQARCRGRHEPARLAGAAGRTPDPAFEPPRGLPKLVTIHVDGQEWSVAARLYKASDIMNMGQHNAVDSHRYALTKIEYTREPPIQTDFSTSDTVEVVGGERFVCRRTEPWI